MEDDTFITQEYVDEYFEDTKMIADEVNGEEDAIELLKRIHHLQSLSEEYYVADVIDEWGKMALNHIESPETYFHKVFYDILKASNRDFTESAHALEDGVIEEKLSEEALFELVMSFDNDIESANMSCEHYGAEKFSKYRFKYRLLRERYERWMETMYI